MTTFAELPIGTQFYQEQYGAVYHKTIFTKTEATRDRGGGCSTCGEIDVFNAYNGYCSVHFCPDEEVYPIEEAE